MLPAVNDSRAGVTALVVEDEESIRRVVVGYLRQEGFAVIEADDGLLALERAALDKPDVIVLDLMLPGLDGIEVCRRLRMFTDAYIIMLTARSEEIDKLIGLSVGADDYLTKPFSPRELVARIRAMMRRPRAGSIDDVSQVRRFGSLNIDPQSREVRLGDQLVDLTRTEFDILDVLSARPQRVHTRRQVIDEVWGSDWFGDDRLVDVHISHIRAKLAVAAEGTEDAAEPRYILTVRGVGFRMGPG